MDNTTRKIVRKLVIDAVILLAVGIPIYMYYLFGKPYRRGFFCDDQSLKHPYHESTVPSSVLVVVGLGAPLIFMLSTEYVRVRNIQNVYKDKPVKIVFGFGAMCSQLLTDIMKYTVGRLRPHFFAVCQPIAYCTEPYQYIEDFLCNSTDYHLQKEMRLSFPSGHSSFSMYCMFYLAIYLQARWTWSGSMLAKHFVQYLSILSAVYTGMSRISDYKHHWSDVLTGLLLGMFIAVLVSKFASDLFVVKSRSVLPLTNDTDNELSARNGNRTTRTNTTA